ncbi:SWIM zinc finger family protein [Methylobacterium sp. A54F]
MTQFIFSVRSEAGSEHYQLKATRTDRGLRFTCSCKAGQRGDQCQHRLALLLKDTRACVEVDQESLTALHDMAEGSPLMHAVEMMVQAQAAAEEAQNDLKRAKKVLATMLGG